jgi:hypothetical protein
MARKNKQQVEALLVAAFSIGATAGQAATQAGVSERTVYRYLEKPEFQARLAAVEEDIFQRTVAVITTSIQGAIHTLVTLLDPSTPPSVRRAAARDTLDLGVRLRESSEVEKRLVALENGVSAANGSAPRAGPILFVPSGKRRRRGDAALQTALACGNTVAQAALKANLSERTAYRRLQDTEFQKGIEALRADMVRRAAAVLIAAGQLAVKTLIELQAATVPASVRRRAARDLIELGDRLRQATVVEKRLVTLEKSALAA